MPFYESNEDTRGFAADQWSQQAQGRVADQWAASAVADAPDRAAAAEQVAQQAAQQQAAAQAQAAAEAQRQADEQARQQAAAAAEAARQQQAAQQAAADQWAGQASQQAASVASTQTDAASQAPPQMPQQATIDSSSPEAFIRSITPWAQQISQQTGIPAAAMIGMAANETGYGKFAAGNNLFGIKGSGPAGSINSQTWEDYGSGPVTIRSNFRAYANPGESFQDFADLVTNAPRYAAAKGQTTVEGFVQALKDGGYMTDPAYVGKISNIVQRFGGVINDALQGAGQAVGGAVQGAAQAATAPVRSTQDILNQVQPFLGQKYVWGGASPTQGGTDCSGFVSYLLGMPQRGTTTTLYGQTSPVQGDPQPGDLVFWNMGQGDMHLQHVGMYVGNGQIVQDGGTQSAINIGSVGQQIGSPPEFRRMGAGGLPAQLADPTTPGHPGPAAIPQQQQPPRPTSVMDLIQQTQATQGRMPTDEELGNFVLSQPPEQTAASVGTPQPIQQPSSPFDVVGNIASGLGNVVSGAVSGATGALGGLFGRGGPGGQPPGGPTETAPTATTSPFPGLPQLPTGMPPEGGGYGVGGPLLPGEAASAFAPIGQAVTGLASSPLLPTNLTNAGLQAVGQNVVAPGLEALAQPGGPLIGPRAAAAQALEGLAGQVPAGVPVVGGLLERAAGIVGGPTIIDQIGMAQELANKYPSGVPGLPDPNKMTPEDKAQWSNIAMAVGGVTQPPGPEAGGSAAERAAAEAAPNQIGGFFQGTQGAMGESILQADVQRLQAQMDAARAKFPGMTNAEAAATPLGQQIESVRQQLVQRTGASPPPAAPVSGTAGGNLPVEQVPEVQAATAGGGAGEPPIRPPTAVGALPPPEPQPEPGLLNRLTQGQPEQAGNITLSKYPADVRQVIADAASSLSDQMKAATRGVLPDQAVRDLSQQTGIDVDQIVRNWNPGQAQNAETLLALRDALTAQARKVIDAQQALRTTPDSVAARSDLLEALTQHAAIQEVVSGSTAEAGRALRQFRQAAPGSDFATNQINQMAARSGMTPEEMASALGRVDLSDPAAVSQLARSLPQGAPTLAEIFKTYHTNNVISGLPTLTHVAVNSILAPAWSFSTRSLADLAGLNFDRVQGGGIGFGAGLSHAGEDFLTGFRDVLNNPASVANRLGGPGGAALKAQGVFGALHGAFQNVAQGIIERTEIGRLAGEAATDQGLKGVAWTKFVADALDNPSAAMVQQARGVAERAALRGELGTLGQKMQQIANVPFIGNTLFPVVKISTNALTQGIERSPLGLLGTGFDVARAVRGVGPYAKGFEPVAGGVTPLSERLTNNLAGTAVTAFLVNKGLDGTITGDGPTDPKERAALMSQGWQPNSLYLPGRGYVDYRVLGPIAQDFALVGNYADAVEEARKHPGQPTLGQDALEIAGNLAQRQASYMSDATGLRTLGQIYEVLHGGANAANVAAQFFGQMAGGFVPESAAVRGLVSAADPYARQPQRGDIGEVIAQGLPGGTPGIGGRTDLPVRLNEMGQPETNPQAGLGIFVPRTGVGQVSPVMTLLGSEGLSPPSAPKTVRVGQQEIALNTDEQRQYQQLRGALLEQMMTPLTQNQQFAQAPGPARKVVLQRLVSQADQVAQRQLIGTIAQTGDLASRLGPGPRQQEPVPFRPPIPLTELTPATSAATSNRAAALPLTSDLATLDPLQQEQMRRQLAGTP